MSLLSMSFLHHGKGVHYGLVDNRKLEPFDNWESLWHHVTVPILATSATSLEAELILINRAIADIFLIQGVILLLESLRKDTCV